MLRLTNTQQLKLGIEKLQMDGPIIDYVRISDSPLMWSQGSIYIEFEPKNLQEFYKNYVLILQELCVCFGIWDLYYLIFLRVQFFRNSGFKQYFWFSGSKLGPKTNQNCNLFVRSILVKTQTFEGFFKHCVCLIGRLSLVKTYHRYIS